MSDLGDQLKDRLLVLAPDHAHEVDAPVYSSFFGKRIWLKGMRISIVQPSPLTAALFSQTPSQDSSWLTSFESAASVMAPAG